MKIPVIILLTLFSSCSTFFNKKEKAAKFNLSSYKEYDRDDYLDQLDFIGESYLKNSDIKKIKLNKESENYFDKNVSLIKVSNNSFLGETQNFKLTIINESIPFHFSIPNGHIFISLGLMKKFIKAEGEFLSILSYEMIRSAKNIYVRNIIIPTGHISTEKIISIFRVPFEERTEINKWAYYIFKRTGFDPEDILSWIQIKNKNTMDFGLQLGDTKLMAREESLFRAFIVKKSIEGTERKKLATSKEFIYFLRDIERHHL